MPLHGHSWSTSVPQTPSFLSTIIHSACHEETSLKKFVFPLLLLVMAYFASPDFCSAQQPPVAPPGQAPPGQIPQDPPPVEHPDFAVKVPRPNAPPKGDYDINGEFQESQGGVTKLRKNVVIELSNATFKADEAEYDENTGIFKARGHVYYRNYERDEVIFCDSAEYNIDTQIGTFQNPRGFSKTKVDSRPGVFTTQEPFYFEGKWAEKLEDKYIIHDGYITDCKVPNPWWTLRSPVFDIVPHERAITKNAIYRLRGIPLFYFPYYYKPLTKMPRHSGFLTPNIGNSSRRGFMLGLGYFWAINRSYDVTYRLQDFTQRGYAHHIDFRGKPNAKTDFDVIFFGVTDRGYSTGPNTVYKAPGFSIYGVIKTDLGNGWTARGNLDYLSSLKFRQEFTESFNEAIFSEVHSTGYITKHFENYTFNIVASRSENFQDATPGNAIIIRKLPEVEFEGRDQLLTKGSIPLWFSFDSTFALLHRVQPQPNDTKPAGFYQTTQFSARGTIDPSLTTAFHFANIDVVPTFVLHDRYYDQQLSNGAIGGRNLLRHATEANVDIVLPSLARIFDKKTFMGDKLKHVIEPRVSYKIVKGVESYNNTIRYDDLDLITDTNEVLLGVTNRLYAKRGDQVNEVFTWEVFQKRFFDPTFGGAVVSGQRNVVFTGADLTGYAFIDQPRHYSPIVNILRASPRNGVGIQWEGDYDPLSGQLVNSMFSTDIRVKKYFVSAGHNLVHPDSAIAPPANQVRGTFGYGETNRKGWSAAVSTVYDYRIGRMQFATVQGTYNTNCCGISVQFRRFEFGARNDNQYRIAFTIANIGSFGTLKKQERLF